MSFLVERLTDTFSVDDLALEFQLVNPRTAFLTRAALFLHVSGGGGKGKEPFARFQDFFAENGISSLAFDHRGVGGSEGTFEDSTLDNRLKEGKAAYRALNGYPFIERRQRILIGASMGGEVAALLSNNYSGVSEVILINPAAYSKDSRDKKMHPTAEFTQAIRVPESWKTSPAFDAIANSSARVLIFRSEYDQVVERAITDRYLEAAEGRGELVIVPNMPHVILTGTTKDAANAREFIQKQSLNFLQRGDK